MINLEKSLRDQPHRALKAQKMENWERNPNLGKLIYAQASLFTIAKRKLKCPTYNWVNYEF